MRVRLEALGRATRLAATLALAACAARGTVPSATGLAPAARPGTKQVLLYADTSFYTFPGGKLVGQFDPPDPMMGLCTDTAGNVWVLAGRYNDHELVVLEYPHGGTEPIAWTQGHWFFPIGCAVERHSGNLAIALFGGGVYDAPGSIVVYPDPPHGAPVSYQPLKNGHYYYCDYDDSGNLFVDGQLGRRKFVFLELPKGAKKFVKISLNPSPLEPGPVEWAGFHIAVADARSENIYQYEFNGSTGTMVRETTLEGAGGVSSQYALLDGVLVYQAANGYGYWNFPAGGNPRRTFQSPLHRSFAISQ